MGGSLYGAQRMPKDKFLILLEQFIPQLKLILGDTEFMPVPYYSEKEDFGDLDIIIKANTDVVRDAVVKHFGFIPEKSKEDHSHQYSTNHNVISFLYETFQIDLICTIADYETSIAYYSFNDVGNILGRFCHKLGLKFGHTGLLYPLRSDGRSIRKEIVISRDVNEILRFLGLNSSKWNTGFTTLEDIFEWVSTGQYFDPTIFERGEMSVINEKRDRKRKTFSKFLDWVEETKPKQNYVFENSGDSFADKDKYIPGIEAFFGVDIRGQQAEFRKKVEQELLIKQKFNGELVMELTGFKDKELGDYINMLKDYVNHIGISKLKTFDDWVLESDYDKIAGLIKFYKQNFIERGKIYPGRNENN